MALSIVWRTAVVVVAAVAQVSDLCAAYTCEEPTVPSAAPPREDTAQSAAPRKPSAARRLVRLFDFEEQAFNSEPVPAHWVRVQDSPPARPRPGFPRWNKAAFDFSVAASGSASVKLPTRGGSTALRLVPGVIPVIPGGEYEVSAKLRTEGLHHARARLVARLADANLEPIMKSIHATGLIQSDRVWTKVAVRLHGTFKDAAWLQIDLELLQPQQFPPGSPERDNSSIDAELEDITGAAWFDDVAVRIIPTVTLATSAEVGVALGPAPPTLFAQVNDVIGDPLSATLRLIDLDGKPVDELHVDPVRPGVQIRWQPSIPAYGWWRAELNVRIGDDSYASTTRDFVWLPTPTNPYEHDRFGLLLRRGVRAPRTQLLELIDASGVGAVDLPYWRRNTDRKALARDLPSLTSLMEQLLTREITVTFALEATPTDLAKELNIEEDNVLEALSAGHDVWAPWLDEALTRFGQQVRRWRLGPIPSAQRDDPLSRAALFSAVAPSMGQSVFHPLPTLPWLSDVVPTRLPPDSALLVAVPPSTPPAALADLAATWTGAAEISIALEPVSSERFGRRATMIDLARRAIRAWQASPDHLLLEQPWVWRTQDDGLSHADPAAELALWSRLGEHLRGRRIVGELPLAPGAVALVLDGPAGGAIVAWDEWAQPELANIDAYLSRAAVHVFDLFGNDRVVDLTDGGHHVALTQAPVFIEGVDAKLARFRAEFAINPSRLESTAERHELTFELSNPWPVAISGELQLVEPATWSFSPQTTRFTIGAGETAHIPIEVSFGLAELAGVHTLRADVRLVATGSYPTITINTPVQVGLSGVEIVPSYEIRSKGDESRVIVTALVINTSDEPITLMAFAQAPGRRRKQAPISDLPPGGAAVRSFVFRDPDHDLHDALVRVGAIETAGLGRLTLQLRIE